MCIRDRRSSERGRSSNERRMGLELRELGPAPAFPFPAASGAKEGGSLDGLGGFCIDCLLYTSPSPRD
eukprot:3109269-Alexandrium_andersonii.AAC.1